MSSIENREPDTYAWKAAPAHLMTRRQLRAAGLAPGGHAPVAQAETKRRGRRLVTYFYDANLAVPKRTATPRQLLAVAKAIQEHQARAAERHGYSRTELTRAEDPAPGWENTTTHKEEPVMSDTHKPDLEVQQVQAETFDIQSQMQARDDAYERGDITWDEYQSWEFDYGPMAPDAASDPPAPHGHGQRIAHLLAVVACNQARQRLDKLDAAVETAESEGRDSVNQLEASLQAAIDRAEARLGANSAQRGPASLAPLVDALVYRTGSDIAADRLDELVSDYALDWGVRIDAEQLSVEVDPAFDPAAAQTFAEAQSLNDRENYALDIVAALPMAGPAKAAVTDALLAWTAKFSEPGLRGWLDKESDRRAELGAALAAAKLSESDRARVEFVVDFLRGDVSEVDLLASPVFVDPGEEVRARIPELLESFAQNPEAAKLVREQISVMTEADQDRVRAAGKAIARGERIDTRLWPDYVDRGKLEVALGEYARDVREMRVDADALAEGQYSQEERELLGHKSPGSQDETSARIDDIVAAREKLLATVRDGAGLAPIERAHLTALVADIDTGRVQELPELLFADERTKCDADFLRRDSTAAQLAAAVKADLDQSIGATHAVDPKTRAATQLSAAVDSIADTLGSVAGGSRVSGVAQDRVEYRENRSRLGQALAQAGVPASARHGIGAVLDEHARTAGKVGTAAIDRADQWDAKVEHVATVRDDTISQRQAADAGRAKPPDAAIAQTPEQRRACTARIDTSLHGVQSPTQAPTGIRQLHSMDTGVER